MMSMTKSGMTKQFWPLLIVPNDSCFDRHDSYSSCAQVVSVGGIGAFGFSVYVIQLALQSFQDTVGIKLSPFLISQCIKLNITFSWNSVSSIENKCSY
jgi:hypothetical protein